MNRITAIAFIAGLLITAAAIASGAVDLASKYLDKPSPTPSSSASPVACSGQHASHQVVIKDNAMVPAQTEAKLCDTLTITNNDTSDRLVAFGPHDDHVPYDGVGEKLLTTGLGFTITLNEAGKYHFHDHLDDVAQGDFTVTR